MSGQSCPAPLAGYLARAGFKFFQVETCGKVHAFLKGYPTIDLVVTEVGLPDGNWSDVVRSVVDCAERASILVTCSIPDEQFWSEALWRGVYDLLIEPYDDDQVRRTVEGAVRQARQLGPRPIASKPVGSVSIGETVDQRLLVRAAG
jgi:DNA-binding NtrC family response regulator